MHSFLATSRLGIESDSGASWPEASGQLFILQVGCRRSLWGLDAGTMYTVRCVGEGMDIGCYPDRYWEVWSWMGDDYRIVDG